MVAERLLPAVLYRVLIWMPAIRKSPSFSERAADVRHLLLMVAGRDHAIFVWSGAKYAIFLAIPGRIWHLIIFVAFLYDYRCNLPRGL
jgi:hypothetical protein